MLTEGQEPMLDWASAARPFPGEQESGDALFVGSFSGGTLVGLIDGLGHGPEAASAARAAVEALALTSSDPVDVLLQRCHVALARTRGAAVSLLSLREGVLSWVGVGNVEAVLLRGSSSETPARIEHLLLVGGIVGQKLPRLQIRSVVVAPGDLLAAASDGLRPDFGSRIDRNASPSESSRAILEESEVVDDSLVWVGRIKAMSP
jgi:negative regulator of sigma-B (phosphoserine phosphatase)